MDNYHEILEDKVNEYHELYALSKQISGYQGKYMKRLQHIASRYYWDSFERNVSHQLERISLSIKKHLISCEEHHEKLRLIHKDLKCGLKRYLFKIHHGRSPTNIKLVNTFLPQCVDKHIMSFLNTRDCLAVKFASVYTDKKSTENILKSMTISTIKKFPYIYNHHYHYRENMLICKRGMHKLLKSYTKSKLIELLTDNFDHLYKNFRDYNLTQEYINYFHNCKLSIDYEWPYDRICGLNQYSIHFDPYYISKSYMVYALQILCGMRIYNDKKIESKKEKLIAKKIPRKKVQKN